MVLVPVWQRHEWEQGQDVRCKKPDWHQLTEEFAQMYRPDSQWSFQWPIEAKSSNRPPYRMWN